MPVRAAGGIVLRRVAGADEWEVALVYRASRGDWGFPKGKLEPGETELFCARREVEEETGLLCNIGAYVGQTQYVDRRKRPKIVHYWLMEPLDGVFAPTEEVDDMQWVPLGIADRVLSYEHDRVLLAKAIRPALADRLFAVRA
jgi:8-oxo-dGTP pyrophosphatase MutT (NUDIX family)